MVRRSLNCILNCTGSKCEEVKNGRSVTSGSYLSILLNVFICVQEGKLYYVGPKKDEKREVVIEAERKRQIFLDCHFNDIGHHLGQKKTVHRIQSKYYWLGIIKDVVDWVQKSSLVCCFVNVTVICSNNGTACRL